MITDKLRTLDEIYDEMDSFVIWYFKDESDGKEGK